MRTSSSASLTVRLRRRVVTFAFDLPNQLLASMVDHPLPDGAKWHTDGWQGTILPYAELVDDLEAESRLRVFAKAVYDLASPTLLI